jgi:hypothetical protein
MERAAEDGAARRQAALAARCATDLTLAWVRTALLGHPGGMMPPAPPPLMGPPRCLNRRTVATLHRAGSL